VPTGTERSDATSSSVCPPCRKQSTRRNFSGKSSSRVRLLLKFARTVGARGSDLCCSRSQSLAYPPRLAERRPIECEPEADANKPPTKTDLRSRRRANLFSKRPKERFLSDISASASLRNTPRHAVGKAAESARRSSIPCGWRSVPFAHPFRVCRAARLDQDELRHPVPSAVVMRRWPANRVYLPDAAGRGEVQIGNEEV